MRKNGKSWKDAIQDGWVPGKNLFEVDEAISKGSIIMNLLSDAAQSETWPHLKPQITKGKASHSQLAKHTHPGLGLCPRANFVHHRRPCTSPTVSPPSSRT